ncbi:hypothetical protein CANINC_000691 [Pichia inconspicua]|uniref:Uncharacterized protein n=1 Tax=Pichia inconspicua TaxID=52247 RepID=A0A4T0X633_9ASCO|nr:hypothetical protein CANINC_000691 [[Candida] inconspicua]
MVSTPSPLPQSPTPTFSSLTSAPGSVSSRTNSKNNSKLKKKTKVKERDHKSALASVVSSNTPESSSNSLNSQPLSPSSSTFSEIDKPIVHQQQKLHNSSQPLNKFLKFTRRATKIAGDIAFGNAYSNDTSYGTQSQQTDSSSHPNSLPHPHHHHHHHQHQHQHHNYQFQQQSQNLTPAALYQKLLIEYNTKLKNTTVLATNHAMEFYTDYLNFFLQYMDESESKDPFIYAITRNALWNQWIRKSLKNINSSINDVLNSTPQPSSENSDHSEIHQVSTLSDESDEQKIQKLKKMIKNIPAIEKIDSELFQDRKRVLLLLWHNQILKALTDQNNIINSLLSNFEKGSEICIITTNKLKSYKRQPNSALAKLFENHTFPSQIELIDAWQIHHDFPNYKTNFVSISDRFQTVLDLKHSGFLPPELAKVNKHFDDFTFLTEEFIHSKLNLKISNFLESYSSFIAPSINRLPIADNSQSVIFSPDFTRLVNSHDDVVAALNEFNRILKSKGLLFLILFDTKTSLPTSLFTSDIPREVRISEYIQLFINSLLSKYSNIPYLSDKIVLSLKSSNFKNVNYMRMAIPAIDYRNDDTSSVSTTVSDSPGEHNKQSIADSPIASTFSMYFSFLDFIRVSHIVNLNDWLNNPQEVLLALQPDELRAFQLWLAWKTDGPNSNLVKKAVIERLHLIGHGGVDPELGVALSSTSGRINVTDGDYEGWYDRSIRETAFEDGDVLGTDTLLLVTAEKCN